ncbi:MAG TPA: putative glycoside hydrolase [Oscillospiraceae bacterium]|nr:putative glycoside hydrolase [Oscillospiraceae bacterium]
MKKQVMLSKLVIFMLIFLFLMSLAGCLQDTFSREVKHEQPLDSEQERQRQGEEQRLAAERMLAERQQREADLQKELGAFFVPLPPLEIPENPVVKAKGLYVTGHTAANSKRFAELLELIEETELNAMVIDVKNDNGLMTYRSEIEIVNEVNGNKGAVIEDIDAVLHELKARDIYPIARVVVFRDPHLPEVKQAWAIQKRNGGGQWRDPKDFAWVNPYEKNVWDYNIAIAKEAALKGFREIQFDYVRFPENAKRVDREAEFPGSNDRRKDEAIEGFLAYAREQLAEYNVHIAADVFGVIATSQGDAEGIGQNWEKVSSQVEYICPMIYPSHYGRGYFGIAVPDANPAGTVTRALVDSLKRNALLEKPAIIRPWLQSFTATWVKGHIAYGPAEVRAQIKAALALGIDEFLIWNAGNRYTPNSYLTADEANSLAADQAAERSAQGRDALGRTQQTALTDYLTAVQNKKWRDAFLWQSRDFAQSEAEYQTWVASWTSSLDSYVAAEQGAAAYTVDVTFRLAETTKKLSGEIFTVVRENGVWKVQPSPAFLKSLTAEQDSDTAAE